MKLPILFCLAAALHAQVHFGIKGGVRLTDDFSGSADSESKRYAVGGFTVFRLPLGFSIETNPLYRRLGVRLTPEPGSTPLPVQSFRAHSFEFALLGRKSIWRGLYAGAGYAPRAIFSTGRNQGSVEVPAFVVVTHGTLASVGIERRFGPILIAPEVRYSLWSQPSVELSIGDFSVRPARNQVDLFLGISF